MMENSTYRKAMCVVSHSINDAVTALGQCEFSGPNQKAALASKMGLLQELVTGAE